MNEPKWPTMDSNRDTEPWFGTPAKAVEFDAIDFIYARAVEDCRAAWLAANDDPSTDPIGTVRKAPVTDYTSVRADWKSPQSGRIYEWLAMHPNGRVSGDSHHSVKGWPVIGAVPGSPAAEAQS